MADGARGVRRGRRRPLRPIAGTPYHPPRGRPPIDLVMLLGGLAVLATCSEPPITAWVWTLERTSVLMRLFARAGRVPGVGTFSGFLDRFYLGRLRGREALRRPSGRQLKIKVGEKLRAKRLAASDRVARPVVAPRRTGPLSGGRPLGCPARRHRPAERGPRP